MVFRLNDEKLTPFADVLAGIYRRGYTCAAQMTARFVFEGEQAKALRERLLVCGA